MTSLDSAKYIPLKYLARIVDTEHKTAPHVPGGGYWIAGTSSVRSGRLIVDKLYETDKSSYREWTRRATPNPADVLLSREAPVGEVALYREGEPPVAIGQRMVLIKAIYESVLPEFLLWVLLSGPTRKFIELATQGSLHPHLNMSDIGNIPIPAASLGEQIHIVEFLNDEVSRIDRMESLQRNVSAKISERDQTFIDLELDRLATRFGVISFRRAIRRIEQGSSPQCDNITAEDGEWGVLKLSSVKRGLFWPMENKRLPEADIPDRRYTVRNGDLLITRANTPELVGDVAVVTHTPDRLLLPDLIYRVEPSKEVTPEFLSITIRGSRVRGLIKATARGTSQSMVKLRGEDIQEWPIPNANLAEQHAVVKQVTEQQSITNSLRSRISRQLDLLAERKQALITAAVTGQIDVTTARPIPV